LVGFPRGLLDSMWLPHAAHAKRLAQIINVLIC